MIGVLSLECNFNADKQTYNPHFHIVVADAAMAQTLVNEWLQLWTPKWAVRTAQNMQPVRGMESALIEIIKYGSKIFTEPDVNKKATSGADIKIYAGGLYQIFDAMKGLRLFERFGFNLPNTSQKAYAGARVVNRFNEWIYSPECHDWLHAHNELVLSGYRPEDDIMKLLVSDIDTHSE